jgi:hypothetical protein
MPPEEEMNLVCDHLAFVERPWVSSVSASHEEIAGGGVERKSGECQEP